MVVVVVVVVVILVIESLRRRCVGGCFSRRLRRSARHHSVTPRHGKHSGLDIESASGPLVVPVPQTGVAGALNLREELFPNRRDARDVNKEQTGGRGGGPGGGPGP